MKQKKVLAMLLGAMLVWSLGDTASLAARNTEVSEVQEAKINLGTPEDVQAVGLTERTVKAKKGCSAGEIQDLLDLNMNGEYHLTVEIPAGTYEMTTSLYIYPNTTIKAAENAKLIKQDRYGAMVETILPDDDGGYDGNYNITIDGGIWDSKPLMKMKDSGTETFRFIHTNNIVVKNATLCNVPEGSHLIVFAGVQNATVTNCKFYGYGNDGNKELSPKEAIQLDTAHSTSEVPTRQDVAWDDLPCDNITITNCEFTDFSRGIGSHTAVAGRIHSNVTITDNIFENLSDTAIRLYNYKDTVVSNNTITNATAGILAYTTIENAQEGAYFEPLDGKVGQLPEDYNITLSDNAIKNIKDKTKVWGDGIRIIGMKGRELAGVTITGNTIQGIGRYGIFATVAPNLTIGNKNKITDTVSDGILVAENSHSSAIYGNSISKAKKSGVAVYDSQSVKVYGNTISAAQDAICLLDAEKCVIGEKKNGNIVTSEKEHGISLSTVGKKGNTGCNSTKVQYNTIKSAKKHGIFVYKAKKATIDKNTVSATDMGISLSTNCVSGKVTNNIIQKAGGHGISITTGSKQVTIRGNTVKNYSTAKAETSGIYVYQSGAVSSKKCNKIANNKITGKGSSTKKNAIKVSESAYTKVDANIIKSAAGAGVYIYKSKNCTLQKNEITSAKSSAIKITTNCDKAKVIGNKVSKAADTAISLYQAPNAEVSKNNVKTTAAYRGIWVSNGSNTSIKSNTVSGATAANAILVTGSEGCIQSKNKIKK